MTESRPQVTNGLLQITLLCLLQFWLLTDNPFALINDLKHSSSHNSNAKHPDGLCCALHCNCGDNFKHD